MSFNLEFTPPALCCRPVAEAEAAAESLKPKQARTLQVRTPRRHPPRLRSVRTPLRRQQPPRRCAAPFDTRFGDAAGELKESKTMSLSNLWQLLMGSFCSTTEGVNTVKKAYKSVEA